MVDKGVLQEFFVDWYYARKLGWEPTTGGPTNLIIPAGSRSVAQIMRDLGRGIVVTEFIGGNSNSTTGDASVGIAGTLFENGVRAQAVAEMNVADNHLKFWHKLVEVATPGRVRVRAARNERSGERLWGTDSREEPRCGMSPKPRSAVRQSSLIATNR